MVTLDSELTVESHTPALLPFCVSISVAQRNAGDPEHGMLTLVHHGGWLRPGEGAELSEQDVSLPGTRT